MTARTIVSLVTSAFTLFGMWAAGSRRWWAWLFGLVAQAVWLVFIVVFEAWGLLPLTVGLVIIYVRNHVMWRRERTDETAPVL